MDVRDLAMENRAPAQHLVDAVRQIREDLDTVIAHAVSLPADPRKLAIARTELDKAFVWLNHVLEEGRP